MKKILWLTIKRKFRIKINLIKTRFRSSFQREELKRTIQALIIVIDLLIALNFVSFFEKIHSIY